MEGAYHQHGEGYSVWVCHTISTEEAHHQYGGRCAVRNCHIISTDVLHFQYGGGYVVRTCHIISMVESVQYGPVTSLVRRRVCSTGLTKTAQGKLVVVFIWEKRYFTDNLTMT